MSFAQTLLLVSVGYFSFGLGIMFVINSAMIYAVKHDPQAIAKLVQATFATFPPDFKQEHEEASLADRQAVMRQIEDHVQEQLDHAWFSLKDLVKVWIWPYFLVEFAIGYIQG
jgi:hypothetical protein